jgi:hypothetical protein
MQEDTTDASNTLFKVILQFFGNIFIPLLQQFTPPFVTLL